MRALVLLFLPICCGTVTASESDNDVAQAFARAANYIYYIGFEHDPVATAFSEGELKILDDNRDALNLMIREAMGGQHSVGGALLSAYFGIDENLDLLRYVVLDPGRVYGWEGSPVSDDWFYEDHQYVYHSRYVEAIEQITGKPLHEFVELTEHERDRINAIASNPRHESREWALWISRKLGI